MLWEREAERRVGKRIPEIGKGNGEKEPTEYGVNMRQRYLKGRTKDKETKTKKIQQKIKGFYKR